MERTLRWENRAKKIELVDIYWCARESHAGFLCFMVNKEKQYRELKPGLKQSYLWSFFLLKTQHQVK